MGKNPTEREILRFQNMNQIEEAERARGFQLICGLDEAGRGPLAGPVTAAACILNPKKIIYGLNDSKKLSSNKRSELFNRIREDAIAYSIVSISAQRIDEINILNATKEAMTQAFHELPVKADLILSDAVVLPHVQIPLRSLVHGDAISNSIAAASILAKVTRDQLMATYDQRYPGWDFAAHKGYGTAKHYEAIARNGLSPIHRLSYLSKLKLGNPVQKTSRECGYMAEQAVAEHLRSQSYRILEQNYSLPGFGEIDLIAMREQTILFIEVKARSATIASGRAEEAIDLAKRRRLHRLASYYMASRNLEQSLKPRLIAAACELNESGQVVHIHFCPFDEM